jgi:hypothetical protein
MQPSCQSTRTRRHYYFFTLSCGYTFCRDSIFLFLPHNASKGEKVEKQVRNKKHTRRGYSAVDIYLAQRGRSSLMLKEFLALR